MPRHFETELISLKEQLVSMAGFVEQAIEIATDSLQKRNASSLMRVHEIEKTVNLAHKAVDETCLKTSNPSNCKSTACKTTGAEVYGVCVNYSGN